MRYGAHFSGKANHAHPRGFISENLHQTRSLTAPDAVALACAGALLLLFMAYHRAGLSVADGRAWPAIGLTVAFALAAWLARGVNTSGALAGAIVAFIMAGRELRIFWVLLLVFLLTLVATRVGRNRKQMLQVAEPETGRSASQVMANLGIAGLILAVPSDGPWHLLALAALAEATADTTSSEVGAALQGKTVLITTWRKVVPGTDGGISLSGTASAAIAAGIVAACSRGLGLVSTSEAAVIACAGTLGMLVDSVLGATLERRRWLNNDLVNLLATAAAVGIAWIL